MTTAKNYLSLGESFEEKGKYFKAERLYKKALRAVEAEFAEGSENKQELLPYLYNLGMIDLHNGSISIDSKINEGTGVTISLPVLS